MKYSVIIPTHNMGNTVGRAVHSALNLPDAVEETLVFDDFSNGTDHAATILEFLKNAAPLPYKL